MFQLDKKYYDIGDKSMKYDKYNEIVPPTQELGGIYLGPIEAASDNEFFTTNNIQAILTVTKLYEPLKIPENQIKHHKIVEMDDIEEFDILTHFKECHDWINSIRSQQINILVHCMAGISRSATIVVSYLMAQNKKPLAETYKFVQGRRVCISPNTGFLDALIKFEKELIDKKIIEGKCYEEFYNEKEKKSE